MGVLRLALLTTLCLPLSALAQQAAPARPEAARSDPMMEAAQQAYEALPEAERKAIQDDLIWGSTFNATVSGSFGPRTFDAIRAFERAIKAQANGILEPAERQALTEAARKARAAVKFDLVTDKPTGAVLGLPLALLPKREPLPMGSLWTSRDEALMVRTGLTPGEADDLPRAFESTLAMDVPGRKVTYKLLRPDFFVVSGEVGPRTFYTRTGVGRGHLVTYTITYPTRSAKQYERVMIALANTFQPVATPATPAAPIAGHTAAAQGSIAAPAGTLPPGLILTGFVAAPGKVATGALAASCPDLKVNGKPARLAPGASSGLSMLEVETGSATPLRTAIASRADTALLIGFTAENGKPVLTVAAATMLSGDGARIAGPLHAEGGGTLVLDRTGSLIGLMQTPHRTPRLVAGIVPAVGHSFTPAVEVQKAAGLTPAPAEPMPLSAGALAARLAPSLVPVSCGQPVPLPK
ncbi:MAG: peptidoglycan-binding protein [Proteobacteria bacterium]|nr:peptidoglycan-binding protein [Pseudomonadota bacterium]